MKTILLIEITHKAPIADLADLSAGRIYSMDAVDDVHVTHLCPADIGVRAGMTKSDVAARFGRAVVEMKKAMDDTAAAVKRRYEVELEALRAAPPGAPSYGDEG